MEGKSKGIKGLSLWKNENEDGKTYFSGELHIKNMKIYENDYCDPEKNHPTHYGYFYHPKKKNEGDQNQEQNQENVQVTVQADNDPKNNSQGADQVPF